MGKHHDKDAEEDERKRQGDGQVPAGTGVSPKEPRGKHSAPDPEESDADESDEDDKDDE